MRNEWRGRIAIGGSTPGRCLRFEPLAAKGTRGTTESNMNWNPSGRMPMCLFSAKSASGRGCRPERCPLQMLGRDTSNKELSRFRRPGGCICLGNRLSGLSSVPLCPRCFRGRLVQGAAEHGGSVTAKRASMAPAIQWKTGSTFGGGILRANLQLAVPPQPITIMVSFADPVRDPPGSHICRGA
jgi:hypothetical protein